MPKTLLTVALAALLLSAAAFYQSRSPISAAPSPESAFDRVMRTETLRCAYTSYPPILSIDPNSKTISGIYHDLVEDMGKRLGWRVVWAEEVGYDTIITGFVTRRYDAFCSPLWPTAARSKVSLFTAPLYYSPIFIWVRPDDTRFDNEVHKLNDPRYRFAMIDGDVNQVIAEQDFPRARHLAISQNSSIAEKILNVVTRKADAFADELITGQHYLKAHPGGLKNAAPDRPVRVYANTILLPENELRLKLALDTAIYEQQTDGTMERIVKRYTGQQPPFYFAAKPYSP